MSESKGSSLALLVGGALLAGLVARSASPVHSHESGMRHTRQTRRIASHEAGHAIVAWAFGKRLVSVSIEDVDRDGQADHGLVRYETPETITHWQRLAIALAGLIGEAFVMGQHDRQYAGQDMADVGRLVNAMLPKPGAPPWTRRGGVTVRIGHQLAGQGTAARIIDEAASYARSIVRSNRTAFDALRQAVAQSGHLNQEDVATVLEPYTPTLPR